MDKQEVYIDAAILLLADIPNNLDDNDPVLTERMQAVFENYFLEYKARLAGKSIFERLEDCSFTVPDSRDMLPDCIDEMRTKLTCFDRMTLDVRNRIKLRRYLAFLEAKTEPDTDKPVKPFPQFITGIEKKELFADSLRKEFSTGKGLQIRYMIEGLRQLHLLTYGDRELQELYDSLKDYFDRDIGSKQGIFNKKLDTLPDNNIQSAVNRINSLLENLFPVE